ncbi:MAG: hypothetical protein R2734_19355 [Nocardioides sp.]
MRLTDTVTGRTLTLLNTHLNHGIQRGDGCPWFDTEPTASTRAAFRHSAAIAAPRCRGREARPGHRHRRRQHRPPRRPGVHPASAAKFPWRAWSSRTARAPTWCRTTPPSAAGHPRRGPLRLRLLVGPPAPAPGADPAGNRAAHQG